MKKISDIINKNTSFETSVFEKILSDKDVIKFIEKYNISNQDIKLYSQVFYDFYVAKNNFKKNTHSPKLKYRNNEIYLEFAETTKQKQLREEKKWSNRIKTEYISKTILTSNFSNLTDDKEKLKLAKNLIEICDKKILGEDVKGMYIYGKTGIGKSYLMGCIYNYLKKHHKEPAIIYFPEFVRKMKSKIPTGEYNDIIDELRSQEILIIDDIGAENITEFVRDDILVPIINYRSTENLLTFFTSNLKIIDLGDILSVTKNSIDETKAMRILDRIRHLATPVYLDSKNEREFL